MRDMNQYLLIGFSLSWVLTFILYMAKKKIFDSGALILLSYVVYSVFSIILNRVPFYGNYILHLFPFLYLYIMELFMLSPVLRFDLKNQIIDTPDRSLFNTISIIFIVSTLIHIPSTIMSFREGLIQILADSSGGADLYAEKMELSNEYGGGITNVFAIFSLAFSGLGIMFLFYSFTQENTNRLIQLGLIVSLFALFVNGVSSGQRGLIIEPLYVALISYFFFAPNINKRKKRIIRITGAVLIILMAIPFIALTRSRFESKTSSAMESVYSYAGQQNINFNLYGLDDGGIRYGDRTIPLFKRMLGFKNVPKNFWERRLKYPNLKVNDEVFYTHIGDFTIDFGPFFGTIIMVLMTFFFRTRVKPINNQYRFCQLILLHFVMYMCMMGGLKLYPFSDVAGNLKVIVYFTAYLLFKNIRLDVSYETK